MNHTYPPLSGLSGLRYYEMRLDEMRISTSIFLSRACVRATSWNPSNKGNVKNVQNAQKRSNRTYLLSAFFGIFSAWDNNTSCDVLTTARWYLRFCTLLLKIVMLGYY